MAKEILKKIKLQIPAGKATPAPPVGTVLGPAGINLQEFCTKFNDASKDKMGDIVPVEITLYADKSYDFVATITKDDLRAIAEIKLPDLNAYTIEEAMKIVEGTARNMGVAVKGLNDAELQEQAKEAAKEEAEQAKRDAELEEMEASAQDTSVDVEVITEKKDEENSEE